MMSIFKKFFGNSQTKIQEETLDCFCPNHGYIDNAIHTFAEVQLRFICAELMNRQSQKKKPKSRLPAIYRAILCCIRSVRLFTTQIAIETVKQYNAQ